MHHGGPPQQPANVIPGMDQGFIRFRLRISNPQITTGDAPSRLPKPSSVGGRPGGGQAPPRGLHTAPPEGDLAATGGAPGGPRGGSRGARGPPPWRQTPGPARWTYASTAKAGKPSKAHGPRGAVKIARSTPVAAPRTGQRGSEGAVGRWGDGGLPTAPTALPSWGDGGLP